MFDVYSQSCEVSACEEFGVEPTEAQPDFSNGVTLSITSGH